MEGQIIQSKIQRRLSESLSDLPLIKSPCHICSAKSKTQPCTHCAKIVCGMHSTASARTSSRICDACFKSLTLSSLSRKISLKADLEQKIAHLSAKRTSLNQGLNDSDIKMSLLQSNLHEFPNVFNKQIEETDKKIEECKHKAKVYTVKIPDLQEKLKEVTESCEIKNKQEEKLTEEVFTMKAEINILIKERTGLVGDIKEVSEFIRSYVPLKVIRKFVCAECYKKVRCAFIQKFQPILQVEEKNIGKVDNIPRRKSACVNCNAF